MTTTNQPKVNTELRRRFTREAADAIRAMLAMQTGRP